MGPQGSVNIKAHASISTPALRSLHRRSVMEQAPDYFVGSLLRDSPEDPSTTTLPDLDDSHAPLDVQPLRSQMGPPPERVRALVSKGKSSKEKSSKQPPTLEEVKAKTILGLITDYQLRQIRNQYGPKVLSEGTFASIHKDTTLFWEFFNYGLRLPISGFVDEVLMTLDRTPSQLMPFTWFVLIVFQVDYLYVGVLPNLVLLSMMYNVIHKGPLSYFQVASSFYNFLYTKKVDKVEPSRWFKLWFLAQGGFGDKVQAHWYLSPSTLSTEDSAKTQTEVEKLLIKARMTAGINNFPNMTFLELLSLKSSSGECVMPHKVNFKVLITGKDPLARISKQKSVAILESSSDVPSLVLVSKNLERLRKRLFPWKPPLLLR
ncbi:hypothetical protein LIER_35215 [Lithospermum erythrorhizon]|uniref:Uncharacterized protein n=1 Tax=Lithospermum erythrorhizon TaxID=34254 RepID=A0AAV3NMS9_LITER